MQEFDKYIKDVCDYIEERMRVTVTYDDKLDSLLVRFDNNANLGVRIYNVSQEYALWRYHSVGATAQQIMRMVKEEWLALLMRKENV